MTNEEKFTVWDNRPKLITLEGDNTPLTDWIQSAKAQLKGAQERTLEDWIGVDEETGEHNRDFLNIDFIIGSDGEYKSVILLDTFGGPNCYLRTDDKEYHLYWGGEHYSVPIDTNICDAIDEHFEEYYINCVKGIQ